MGIDGRPGHDDGPTALSSSTIILWLAPRMRDGHLVVDVDAHYLEPIDELPDYMDEPIRSQIKGARNHNKFIPLGLGDRALGERIKRPEFVARYRDKSAVFDIDDVKRRLGIDAFVLVSNQVLSLAYSSQIHVIRAYYRAYMDYMLERAADPDRGAYLMIPVSWQDPEGGAELIHRTAVHPAVVAACVVAPTTPLGGERYNAIYLAAQEHDLPVVFHSSSGPLFMNGIPVVGDVQNVIEGNLLGFSVSNLIQIG